MRLSLKHPWLLAGALAFLAVVLTFDPKLYVNGDNVDYMNLARGVRQGHLWASDKYPPVFPWLLASVQALFGMRLLPQKILVTAFAGGAIWLLAGIVRRRAGPQSGPWLLFVAATLISFVEYAHYVMSEVPFLFFQLGAIRACDRLGDRASPPALSHGTVGLTLWIAAAFYTRTAGVALAASVLLWLLLNRKPRHAVVLTGLLAVALVPWLLHSLTTTGGNPYFRQLLRVDPYYPEFGTLDAAGLLQRVGENARVYLLWLVPATVMPARYSSTYSLPDVRQLFFPLYIAIPLLVPFAAGLWRGLRGPDSVRKVLGCDPARPAAENPGASFMADPVACVVIGSLILLCLWPSIWSSSRFLAPIVPLLPLVWWGGWRLPEEIGLRGPWAKIRTALLVLLVFLGVRNLVLYARETKDYPPVWANYFASLTWISQNTPPDAVIIDRKPGFVEFVTGRKAMTIPKEKDPARMIEGFRQSGITHVVVAPLPFDDIQRYLVPTIDRERSYFRPLYWTSQPKAYVLGFHPEGGQGSTNSGERPAPPR